MKRILDITILIKLSTMYSFIVTFWYDKITQSREHDAPCIITNGRRKQMTFRYGCKCEKLPPVVSHAACETVPYDECFHLLPRGNYQQVPSNIGKAPTVTQQLRNIKCFLLSLSTLNASKRVLNGFIQTILKSSFILK